MTEQHPDPTPPYAPSKRLTCSKDDRWLAGVCGGIAQYTGVDANLIRLLVVLGTVFGLGSLLVAYVVAWIVMPEA